MKRRSAALVLAAACTALLATAGGTAAAATGTAARTPIEHVVVLMQDHRSFDSYLGRRAGVEGVPEGVCMPSGTDAPCVEPFPLEESDLVPALNPSATVQRAQIAAGAMDGFVSAYAANGQDGRAAMGYYRPQDLPVLDDLADQYTVLDRWFSSSLSGTIQNRMFAMAARAASSDSEVPQSGWGETRFVFDELQRARISWRVYVEDYEAALNYRNAGVKARRGGQLARVPLLGSARYLDDPALAGNIVDLGQYYSDLADGRLPSVSYVVTTRSSEHPPRSPAVGQRVVRNVVNALGQSAVWSRSALLLTYDSSGGFYDHVPPASTAGGTTGLRVPAVLVSPYVRPGSVHSTTFDHASLPRFIEDNWGLPPLTERDRSAGRLLSAFDFDQQPRRFAVVGQQSDVTPLQRPKVVLVYVIYGGVLALTAVVVTLLVRAGPQPSAPAPDPVERPAPAHAKWRAEEPRPAHVRAGT